MLVTWVKEIENERLISKAFENRERNSTCLQISDFVESCNNQLIFPHINHLFLKTVSIILGSKYLTHQTSSQKKKKILKYYNIQDEKLHI